ncbi:MAG: hypothetical protein KJ568_02920 [Actinobacteria bacterium]|nr:hypothetical protein [Actinomycetota bacterium]
MTERFALLTLSGKSKPIQNPLFAYECVDVEDINDEKIYALDFEMIKKFNPNTETCPVFLNEKDIQIAQKIYSKFDVIVNENNNINKWGISYVTQIHMSGGSHLFNNKEELQKNGYKLNINFFKKDNDVYIPLYEGKYIQNYDYRFASFENIPADKRFSKKPATYTPTLGQKQDVGYEIEPRYWIDEKKYIELKQKCKLKYQFQFCCRLVTNVISNARTCIGCIMPTYPANNLCLILNFKSKDVIEYSKKLVLFNAIFSSFVFDYIARQKVTANMLKSVLWQLPLPSLTYFDDMKINDISLKDYIIDRVIKLIACTSGTKYIASILGYQDAPYIWDKSERERIRTELDVIMAYVYGISHNDLSYILDTFPIVKKKDNQKYGEYRTKRLILEKYDELKDKFKNL